MVWSGTVQRRRGLGGPLAAVVVVLLWLPAAAHGQLPEELKTSIELMRVTGVLQLDGQDLPAPPLLAEVYARRQFAPLWADAARRAGLRVAISSLVDDGLDPADYHLPALVAAGAIAAAEWTAAADILHTHALLLAALHLRHGRVDATTLAVRRLADAPPALDAVIGLQLVGQAPSSALAGMRPDHHAYAGLSAALRQLRQVQRVGGWERVTVPLQRDSSSAAVARLRRRLVVAGDLPTGADTVSLLFDAALEAAVQSFQHRHGLNEDGIVGPATLRELDMPVAARIDQVRINLERGRWILHDLPDTFVAVNVAGALAYVVRAGETVFETRVIVGRTATRTPVFSATLRHIDLNPYWTVPPGIVHEILALVRSDPGYLARTGMRVVDASGRIVPAAGIDFGRYTGRTFPWVFRQDPGALNPLGGIRLVFPNQYNVYLHDTPARELFAREQRTFSHGCVRVQSPLQLAELVLADSAWSVDSLAAAIATGRSRTIPLRRPLPILILYWTAATDLHGELHFYRDVYGRDAALLQALAPGARPSTAPPAGGAE